MSLSELADEAAIILESEFDYGPNMFERDPSHTDMDLIYMLYRNCWCDYFSDAIYRLTKWPIVGVSSRSKGGIHRVNRAHDGQLVDVTGYVTLDNLQAGYGYSDLYLTENIARDKKVASYDDHDISMVTQVFLHLNYEPFTSLRSKTRTRLMVIEEKAKRVNLLRPN